MIEEQEDQFGAFDFGDEKLEQPKSEVKEKEEDKSKTEEENDVIDDNSENDTDENTDNSEDTDPSSSSEEETVDESLDDESIFKEYGEDVKPEIVRHYKAIEERLFLSEDFKFDGKNIDEAYEQDFKNRNTVIAQNIIDKLPEKAKSILATVLETGEDISPEAFDKIITLSKDQLKYDFETGDEDKDIENAKAYLTSVYKEKGLKDRVIKSMLEDLEDERKLISEAKEEKEEKDKFIKEEQAKIAQAEAQKKIAERENAINFKNSIEAAIKETKYAPEKAKIVRDQIFNISKEDGQSELINTIKAIYSNPKALIVLSELTSTYDKKTGKWDLPRLEAKAKTEEVRKVKESIESKLTGKPFQNNSQRSGKTTAVNWEEIEL